MHAILRPMSVLSVPPDVPGRRACCRPACRPPLFSFGSSRHKLTMTEPWNFGALPPHAYFLFPHGRVGAAPLVDFATAPTCAQIWLRLVHPRRIRPGWSAMCQPGVLRRSCLQPKPRPPRQSHLCTLQSEPRLRLPTLRRQHPYRNRHRSSAHR